MKDLLAEMGKEERAKLVAKQVKRGTSSAQYYKSYFENWKIYYKVYHSIRAEAAEDDEPNMLVPIAYGIVEDAVARLVIPLLQKLPIIVRAKVAKFTMAAENFYNACKDYFGSDDYRLDRIASEREYVICGNAWEVYGWAHNILKGKEWRDTTEEEEIEYETSFMDKMMQKIKTVVGVNGPREVPKEFPEQIGFETRFPSIFSMLPEPGIKKFKNMSWVIEAEGVVSLADLEKASYIDPESRDRKQAYDLTELLKGYDGQRDKVKPEKPDFGQGEEISQIISGRSTEANTDSDEPSVYICRTYQKDNTILVWANGKYLIQAITEVYHYPVMPVQLRVYTQDKENLFGDGIIKPILELLYEVNDIHNMSFQNWIRSINKMIVYDESVIKYKDDFTPRAGGKIRANLLMGGKVSDAFSVVDYPDVSTSMINMESQSMGKIEKTISISDLTPGSMGTKAYHKTYGGLMEIQASFARRFEIMSMTELAYVTKQMKIMYWMFMQFMFDDMPMGRFEDGVFVAETYKRDDFNTDGQGFIFAQSMDPSFGDAAIERNQLMVLLDQGLKYENYRMDAQDPEMPRVAVDEIMRMNLNAFGVQDISKILTAPDGVIAPEKELIMITQGMKPQVNPKENFVGHLIAHVGQRNDPMFVQTIASGKVPPEVLTILDEHIQETMNMIQMFMQNIDEIAQAKKTEDMMKDPMYGKSGPRQGGMNTQNIPAPPEPDSSSNAPAGMNNGSGLGTGGMQ